MKTAKGPLLLIDGRSLATPSVGVGVYSTRLIHGLLRQAPELEFKVLLPHEVALDTFSFDLTDSQVIFIPSKLRIGHDFLDGIASQIALSLFLRRHYPTTLFHATNLFWSPLRPGLMIVTLHDVIPRLFPRYFGRTPLRRIMHRLQERFAAKANHILAVSQCTARDAARLAGIPAEIISVLPNWVGKEFPAFDRQAQADRIESVRKKYILPQQYWLYLGGYDYRKNIEFLIRAYATAHKKATLPPLVLAGSIPTDLSKPYCDVLGSIRETGLTPDSIIMPGRIATEDLPALYAGASLLIYPSLYEGFGYPPAEAMAVGTPVLVSDSSSLPEVVRRAECRFDPLNQESLSRKLLEAALDPEKFLSPLPREFTEEEAIRRYVEIVKLMSVG